MVENKPLNSLLLQLTLGASLAFIPALTSAAAMEPALLFQDVEDDTNDDDSKFSDRSALADILFGENADAAALNTEIADLDADILAKEAEITTKTTEFNEADEADKPALQTQLDTLNGDLTTLKTTLTTKTGELEAINADHTLPLADLTDEQVFAMNRSFNGWVNNAFDVTLSEELIARLLSGDLTDEQVRFAIKAEFEGEKFNQLANRLEEKGHTEQAQRMRDRGETQKERFNDRAGIDTGTATGATSDIITDQAKGAAHAAVQSAVKDEAKGQAKAEVKRAAKEDMRENSKRNAKSMAKGNN